MKSIRSALIQFLNYPHTEHSTHVTIRTPKLTSLHEDPTEFSLVIIHNIVSGDEARMTNGLL